MSLVRVFLYGTLKRGQPNYYWLTNKENGYAKFVCEAVTLEKFPLVVTTSFNIPFLLNVPGMGHQVKGEVYEIDEKMLKNLDVLEDYPTCYEREKKSLVRVGDEKAGEKFEGVLYYLKDTPKKFLELEFLEEYKDDPKRPYQPNEINDFNYDDLLKEAS
ncbi:putative gamma-glutamylcyclotransferase CG2811 [Culicoides brevitarsis]|uniref:putative gamma-glutamylcyclotransferase CG2811 n=1 Tax=Culicoides brevitarsis TaxID=469753 RepID=UPI00307B8623